MELKIQNISAKTLTESITKRCKNFKFHSTFLMHELESTMLFSYI